MEGMSYTEIGRSLVPWNLMKTGNNSSDQEGGGFHVMFGGWLHTALKTVLRSFIIYCMIKEEPLRLWERL